MHGLDVIKKMNDRAVEKAREGDGKCQCGRNTLDIEERKKMEPTTIVIQLLCRKKAA